MTRQIPGAPSRKRPFGKVGLTEDRSGREVTSAGELLGLRLAQQLQDRLLDRALEGG